MVQARTNAIICSGSENNLRITSLNCINCERSHFGMREQIYVLLNRGVLLQVGLRVIIWMMADVTQGIQWYV